MSFREWLLTEAKIEEIPNYVLQSIQHLVGGKWEFLIPPRNDIPSLRFQWRLVCEINGHDVRMDGDRFYLKMFIQSFKKPEWISKNPSEPQGYFGGSGWWGSTDSTGRAKKMKEFGEPFDHVSEYDPRIGHPLVKFAGHLEGWRPGMMPSNEIDHLTDMQNKGYPIPVSKTGDFRWGMERIVDFWDNKRLNTPYEVAKHVKEAIGRFYGPRGDDDEPEPETPIPSRGIKIKV